MSFLTIQNHMLPLRYFLAIFRAFSIFFIKNRKDCPDRPARWENDSADGRARRENHSADGRAGEDKKAENPRRRAEKRHASGVFCEAAFVFCFLFIIFFSFFRTSEG